MSRLSACLCLAAAMALVGANVPLGKILVANIPVMLFIFYRFFISIIALIVFLPGEPGKKLRELDSREYIQIAFMALVGMVMFSILILEGVRRTSGTDAGIITATLPAMVAFLGIIIFREKLRIRQAIAIFLAIVGVGLIHTGGTDERTSTTIGNLLIVGAVCCEAMFVILAKQLSLILSPVRLAFGANIAGLIIILPFSWREVGSFDYGSLDLYIIALAFWYIIAASVLALLLWYRALPHVETSIAGLMTTALPLSAMLVSVLFLGEIVGFSQIIGAALVISAIWIGSVANMKLDLWHKSRRQ